MSWLQEISSSAMQEGGTSLDSGDRRNSAVEMKNKDGTQKRSALEEILRSTRTRTTWDLPSR